MGEQLRELVARACRSDRLYPIKGNESYGFYAGQLPDGHQALAILPNDLILGVAIFDAAGNLVRDDAHDLAGRWPVPDHGYPEVDHAELYDYLRAEFGFLPALIRVREFAMDYVSIAPLPSDYFEFVDDPESPSFDDRQRGCFPEYIREWVEAEQFVLQLGEHYWMDNNGEVTAS